VEKYYTTLNCVKQAIQPEVVGPLLYLRCIVYIDTKTNPIGFGTSIDYINCVSKNYKLCAGAQLVRVSVCPTGHTHVCVLV
jgi:hypothetical protein